MLNRLRNYLLTVLTPKPSVAVQEFLALANRVVNDPTPKPGQEKLQKVLAGAKTKRQTLFNLIFPSVIKLDGTHDRLDLLGRVEVDKEQSKQWALACAQLVGYIAALAIKPALVNLAIDEMATVAKTIAANYNNRSTPTQDTASAGAAATSASPTTPPALPAPAAVEREKRAAVSAAKERYIQDLEAQAELESNEQAKEALKRLAENMRKELELDKVA